MSLPQKSDDDLQGILLHLDHARHPARLEALTLEMSRRGLSEGRLSVDEVEMLQHQRPASERGAMGQAYVAMVGFVFVLVVLFKLIERLFS